MGYSTVNLGSGSKRTVRAWIKVIKTAGNEECLVSYVASEISSIVWDPTVNGMGVKVTMVGTHNFAEGDICTISGTTGGDFNFKGNVSAVTASTFYVDVPKGHSYFHSKQTASITATITNAVLTGEIYTTRAVIVAQKASRTQNTDVVYIGPQANGITATVPLNPGEQYLYACEAGNRINLGSLFLYAGTVNDGAIIMFH